MHCLLLHDMFCKYIYIVVFVWLSGFALNAQQSNPFDIKNRLDSVYQSIPAERDSSDTSPGGVIVPGEELLTSDQDMVMVDPREELVPLGSNPFEVDHVPIRKSELKEKSVVAPTTTNVESKNVKSDKVSTPSPGTKSSGLLVFIIAIISLILLAIVASTRRSIFNKLVRSFTNDNVLKLTQREENGGMNGAFMILYLIFLLNLSSLIYLITSNYSSVSTSIWFYVFLGVIAVYIIRHVSLFLFSIIFPVEREVRQFSFMIGVFNILLGLILIPINMIIAYAPDSLGVASLYIGLGIVGFVFVVRALRGFLLGLVNYGNNVFHFFLYLCTFEIVPILLIIRFISNLGLGN